MADNAATLTLTISQMAELTGIHRSTISGRLKNLPLAPGSNEKRKSFRIADVLTALFKTPVSDSCGDLTPESMTPKERKDWYDSEKGRIWLDREQRRLIPADEVVSVYSVLVKTTVSLLETLPDVLERDAALPPDAVHRVQSVVDTLRDDLQSRSYEACAGARQADG